MTDWANDEESARWNYRPAEPVALNPLFGWPPRPMAILRWYSSMWLQLSTVTLCAAMAGLVWWLFLPPLESMTNWHWSWMTRVYLANFIPHVLIASLLHLWLYRWRGQERRWKFDARDPARNSGHFTFRNQVHDNMFWTIASGITLWTAFQWLVFWAMANGWTPGATFYGSPVWFVLAFPFLVMWSSFHFYWIHRMLHVPWIYRTAHSLHHRNINVGPWSGISMHPLEHFLFYTNFLIHLVVPSHPVHLLFHGYIQSIHPIFSHSGFERLDVSRKDRAMMGDFFHQLHHRYFECNYGTIETPWDRLFGTFHDGSGEATRRTRDRKRRMQA